MTPPRLFSPAAQNYFPTILEKSRIFVSEWDKLAAGGEAHVPSVHEWVSAFTADAVVRVRVPAA